MGAPVPLKNASDAYVSEKYPAKHYYDVKKLFLADGSAADTRYVYLYFGLPSGIIDTTVSYAKLRVWSGAGFSGDVTLSVHRLGARFSASKVNWNNKPAVVGSPVQLTKTSAPSGTMWEFTLTSMAQTVANGAAWYGVRISATGSAAKWLHSAQATDEFRPELEVAWSDAPDQPENLIPDNGLSVSVAKPTLQWDFIDPSGDQTMQSATIKLYGSQANADADTAPLSTINAPISVPEFDLDDPLAAGYAGLAADATLWWRVLNVDGAGLPSALSDVASFKRTTKGTLTVTNPAAPPADLWPSPDLTGFNANAGSDVPVVDAVGLFMKRNAGTSVLYANRSLGPMMTGAGTYTLTIRQWISSAGVGAGNQGIRVGGSGIVANLDSVTTLRDQWVTHRVTYTWDGVGGVFVYPQGGTGSSSWFGDGIFLISGNGYPYAFVNDNTPPFSWTFTGRTQVKYEVILTTPEKPAKWIWTSGVMTSTDTAVTPPTGKITEKGKTYRLIIRIYDDKARITVPDDPIYVEVVRDFVYQFSSSVSKVTNLTRTMDNILGKVTLEWDDATAPDDYVILRDGKQVLSGHPVDLLVSGTHYKIVDDEASPRKSHTWEVARKVNGVTSDANPTITDIPKTVAPILSTIGGGKPVLFLNPDVAAEKVETSDIHYILGNAPPILVSQSIRGYEGQVSGVLSNNVAPGLTADDMLDNLNWMKANPGTVLKFTWINRVMKVVIRAVSDQPLTYPDGTVDYLATFELFEVGF